MSKKKENQKQEVVFQNTEVKTGFSVEDLKEQLIKKEKLRVVLEQQYHVLNGQIQLLAQQIAELQEKNKR